MEGKMIHTIVINIHPYDVGWQIFRKLSLDQKSYLSGAVKSRVSANCRSCFCLDCEFNKTKREVLLKKKRDSPLDICIFLSAPPIKELTFI